MAPKRKPMLPSTSDIAFADSLMANAHVEGVVEVDELSAKLRSAFEMLGEVAETMTELRAEQPRRMDPYAEEFMRMFLDAGLDMEQAGTLLGGFFSSTLLARILGDVAAGNLDPVVAVPRVRAPKVKEAEEPVAPVAPVEPAPPAKAKRTPRKKAEPVPEPVSAPVDEETADAVKRMIEDSSVPVTPSLSTTPDDEHVNPADLDELASLPEVTPPDPAPVAPAAPPVPQVPLTPFDSEPNPDF